MSSGLLQPELRKGEKLIAKLGVVLLLTAMLIPAALRMRGHEPYPALLQPDFSGAPKVASFSKAEIRPLFEDGTSTSITYERFLGNIPVSHRAFVMERVFREKERSVHRLFRIRQLFPGLPLPRPKPASELDRELRTWIRYRMNRLFPGRRVRAVQFVWRTFVCDLTLRPLVRTVVAENQFEVTLAND